MRVAYEERIVAFVDILGMRQHLAGSTSHQFVKNVVTIIGQIIKPTKNAVTVNLRHIAKQESIKASFSGWSVEAKGCRVTSISDSIVVSLPLNAKIWNAGVSRVFNVYLCLHILFWLQRQLAQLGILVRGGVSVGSLYHSKSIVVGSGLVAAYELESQIAIYPRIILHREIVEILLKDPIPEAIIMQERIGFLLRRDSDGLYYIDYLGLDITEVESDWEYRLGNIQAFIREELVKTGSMKVQQKLLWLDEYARQAALWWKEPGPHRTNGVLEKRYPRSPRSLE